MKWYRASTTRELGRPEVGTIDQEILLTRAFVDRFEDGEECYVARSEYRRYTWVAFFPRSRSLARLTTAAAQSAIRTERTGDGALVPCDADSQDQADQAWAEWQDSRRTIYHGD